MAKYSLGSGLFKTWAFAPSDGLNPTLAVTKDFSSKKQQYFYLDQAN
jgi:hypothetical protein